ncbi:MAG: sulfurtransferase-like selenium metabolism protein YedF [Tissierellia bacterium]|nr:sulfurtransferase-like selenium metabolism protein YedF [Tissierellia bacterium]
MKIDALGLACPRPVILARRAINDRPEENIIVLVDNLIATENLKKMAEQLKLKTQIREIEKEVYEVEFFINENSNQIEEIKEPKQFEESDYIIVLSSEGMGLGDEEFSGILMENFIYSLLEMEIMPKAVLLYNKGVKLSTTNEKTVEDLKALERKGVEILSCGLCLNYYNLAEQLQVGSITNMYRICELMTKNRVVKP